MQSKKCLKKRQIDNEVGVERKNFIELKEAEYELWDCIFVY